jgi:hypothetical protein
MGGKHVFRTLPAILPGKGEVFMADPRLLLVDSDYNCRDMTSADTLAHIDWLAESIETSGFNPEMPLTVRRRDHDAIVVRGHCRLAAIMKLIAKGVEFPAVPVMQIAAGTSDVDLIFDQESSNYGLRLDPLARARLVLKARRMGVSDEEIAKRMHWKTVDSVRKHLEMLEVLPEQVKQQVSAGDIAATEAVKVVKNLPAGTDPALAAKLIAENKEENRRLGVGAKRDHKVTAKTLRRDRPKVEPKPNALSDDEKKARAQALRDAQDREASDAQDRAIFNEQNPGTESVVDHPEPSPAAAPGASMAVVLDKIATITAPKPVRPNSSSRIDELLLEFISHDTDVNALASMHARLNREHDDALAADNHTVAQLHLIHAADAIGSLRFPDEWENAKGAAELQQVA